MVTAFKFSVIVTGQAMWRSEASFVEFSVRSRDQSQVSRCAGQGILSPGAILLAQK